MSQDSTVRPARPKPAPPKRDPHLTVTTSWGQGLRIANRVPDHTVIALAKIARG